MNNYFKKMIFNKNSAEVFSLNKRLQPLVKMQSIFTKKNNPINISKKLASFYLLSLFLINPPVYAKSTSIENIDKNIQDWKYFVNSKELSELPEIYIGDTAKYFPIDILKNLGANYVLDYKNKKAYITNNDESFEIKDGSKQIYVNNQYFSITNEFLWKNKTMYIPSSFLTKLNVSISENKYKNETNIIKAWNIITDINTNTDVSELKIAVSLSSTPVFEEEKGKDYYKITLFGTNTYDLNKIKNQLEHVSSEFKKVELNTSKGIATIVFYTKEEVPLVNTYAIEKPDRLIIQFPKSYKTELKNLKEDGLYHSKIIENNFSSPNKINLLELNTNRDFILKPLVSRDDNLNFSLRDISHFGKDFNCIATINAGFFSSKTKSPLGTLIINNELISAPLYNRSAFFINKDGSFNIKNLDMKLNLKVSEGENEIKTIKVNAFNLEPQKNQVVAFNYNYLKNQIKSPNKENNNEYSYYYLNEETKKLTDSIPDVKKGVFIYASGSGKDLLETYLDNNKTYELNFDFSESLDNVLHAIGGGPTLIRDGIVNITAKEEQFKPDITEGKAPRTALGLLTNNKIIILTVDGRQEFSKGMTLEELAYFFKKYNVKSAINFDGGGSTAMFLENKVINSVSDPKERKVSNALGIFRKNKS